MTEHHREQLLRRLGRGAVAAGLAALAVTAMAADRPRPSTPLKEAKLIIEHNATDHDTGFQCFVDSEGWDWLEVTGPRGVQLRFEGRGGLGELGLTELFFESVEPENKDKPLADLFEDLPAGEYRFRGHTMIDGESGGELVGIATLTHTIPAGPELLAPAEGATVPVDGLQMRWGAVTRSLEGAPVEITGYQLILERDAPPEARMIGKWGLSMYLPATVTAMDVPRGFLQPGTAYNWEVLAIEKGGNQTLSSGKFRTR